MSILQNTKTNSFMQGLCVVTGGIYGRIKRTNHLSEFRATTTVTPNASVSEICASCTTCCSLLAKSWADLEKQSPWESREKTAMKNLTQQPNPRLHEETVGLVQKFQLRIAFLGPLIKEITSIKAMA